MVFLQNVLKVDQQTSAGKNANVVSHNTDSITVIDSDKPELPSPNKSNNISFVIKPRSPIHKPVAAMIGIMGTKISPNKRINFFLLIDPVVPVHFDQLYLLLIHPFFPLPHILYLQHQLPE